MERRRSVRALLVGLAVLGLSACGPGPGRAQGGGAEELAPELGDGFWEHWGDGRAELAGYDLVTRRYGEERRGTAVAIFVTEPFSEEARVKAERTGPGTFQALKLNLVQDFPTGVYDYNLMTSAFVALEAVAGLPAGGPVKVSFSGQEWCGHVYQQALFRRRGVDHVLHSYFEGEADRRDTLSAEPGGTSEDALLLWARGLAFPEVAPGATVTVPALTSLERSRLAHVAVTWDEAELSRAPEVREVTVPAGTFRVREARATLTGPTGDRSWSFLVEEEAPHRIVAWETGDGERAELLGADRMPYWELNGPGGMEHLERFGLRPREPRTP